MTFNQAIPIVDSHKHLGVTFSLNSKWNTHIDNIIKIAMKHITFKFSAPIGTKNSSNDLIKKNKV